MIGEYTIIGFLVSCFIGILTLGVWSIWFNEPFRYRIAWQNYKGDIFYGAPLESKELAESWVRHLNGKYPELKHRVDECTLSKLED
jgi:hypothetical protein